jgi:hypothetical protein
MRRAEIPAAAGAVVQVPRIGDRDTPATTSAEHNLTRTQPARPHRAQPLMLGAVSLPVDQRAPRKTTLNPAKPLTRGPRQEPRTAKRAIAELVAHYR